MRGRPPRDRGKFQADFPLHFPPPASGESAGTCRQPLLVAVVRAFPPGDFRSRERKKWEARKNIPHGVWVRVEAPGFGGSHGNRFPCSRGNSRIRRRARTLPNRRGKPFASEVNAAGMGVVASLRICLVARACLWRCKPSPSFHRTGPLSPLSHTLSSQDAARMRPRKARPGFRGNPGRNATGTRRSQS